MVAWLNTQSSGSAAGCGCSDSTSYDSLSSEPNVTSVTYGKTSFSTAVGSHMAHCTKTSTTCGRCNRYNKWTPESWWYYPMSSARITPSTNTGHVFTEEELLDAFAQVAEVRVPFNYKTSPKVSINSSKVVFGGGDVPISVSVSIDKRSNPDVTSDPGGYATVSKTSAYEIVAYTVAPGVAQSNAVTAGGQVGGSQTKRAWPTDSHDLPNGTARGAGLTGSESERTALIT